MIIPIKKTYSNKITRRCFCLGGIAGLTCLAIDTWSHGAEEDIIPRGIVFVRYRRIENFALEGMFYRDPKSVETIDPQTGEVRQLANLPTNCVRRSPVLSPDGRFLAYCTAEEDYGFIPNDVHRNSELYVQDLRTGKKVKQTNDCSNIFNEIVWRPDGRQLAVSSGIKDSSHPINEMCKFRDNKVRQYSFDPERMKLVMESEHTSRWAPAYSPNGQKMITQSTPGKRGTMLIEDSKDNSVKELAPGMDSQRPLWSSRNDILFYSPKTATEISTESSCGLWIVNPDGSELKKLQPNIYALSHSGPVASWSPDGRMIATKVREDGEPLDLCDCRLFIQLIDVSSRKIVCIRDKLGPISFPQEVIYWAPNSQQIAFVSAGRDWLPGEKPYCDILITDTNGKEIQRFIEGPVRIIDWR